MDNDLIFGIDLGTKCGISILRRSDLSIVFSETVDLSIKKGKGFGYRYLVFEEFLLDKLASCADAAVVIGYEKVHSHIGTIAAHIYGGLEAVVTKIAEQKNIPIYPIGVGTIKKRATGSGKATKDEVVVAANSQWPEVKLKLRDNDVADALWIAVCASEL